MSTADTQFVVLKMQTNTKQSYQTDSLVSGDLTHISSIFSPLGVVVRLWAGSYIQQVSRTARKTKQ